MSYTAEQLRSSQLNLNTELMNRHRQTLNQMYEDLEEVILCAMSAGVPASLICVSTPVMNFNTRSYTVECGIGFVGQVN